MPDKPTDEVTSSAADPTASRVLPSPARTPFYAEVLRGELDLRKGVATIIGKTLSADKDRQEGFLYVAQACGELVGDRTLVKIGWSGKLDEARLGHIETKCKQPVKTAWVTPHFQGARRVEAIIHAWLHNEANSRMNCGCGHDNREWFEKEVEHIKIYIWTLLSWMAECPYDFDIGELRPEWKTTWEEWKETFNSEKPESTIDFLSKRPTIKYRVPQPLWLSSPRFSRAKFVFANTPPQHQVSSLSSYPTGSERVPDSQGVFNDLQAPDSPTPNPRNCKPENNDIASTSKLPLAFKDGGNEIDQRPRTPTQLSESIVQDSLATRLRALAMFGGDDISTPQNSAKARVEKLEKQPQNETLYNRQVALVRDSPRTLGIQRQHEAKNTRYVFDIAQQLYENPWEVGLQWDKVQFGLPEPTEYQDKAKIMDTKEIVDESHGLRKLNRSTTAHRGTTAIAECKSSARDPEPQNTGPPQESQRQGVYQAYVEDEKEPSESRESLTNANTRCEPVLAACQATSINDCDESGRPKDNRHTKKAKTVNSPLAVHQGYSGTNNEIPDASTVPKMTATITNLEEIRGLPASIPNTTKDDQFPSVHVQRTSSNHEISHIPSIAVTLVPEDSYKGKAPSLHSRARSVDCVSKPDPSSCSNLGQRPRSTTHESLATSHPLLSKSSIEQVRNEMFSHSCFLPNYQKRTFPAYQFGSSTTNPQFSFVYPMPKSAPVSPNLTTSTPPVSSPVSPLVSASSVSTDHVGRQLVPISIASRSSCPKGFSATFDPREWVTLSAKNFGLETNAIPMSSLDPTSTSQSPSLKPSDQSAQSFRRLSGSFVPLSVAKHEATGDTTPKQSSHNHISRKKKVQWQGKSVIIRMPPSE